MERKSSRTPEKNPDLSVQKVLAEFRKSEESTAHRKGTFKIDMPFEDALKIVAHAKPTISRQDAAQPQAGPCNNHGAKPKRPSGEQNRFHPLPGIHVSSGACCSVLVECVLEVWTARDHLLKLPQHFA
jgi:hypothetical protein